MRKIFGKKIVTDPEILVGKPIIKGTRVPVDLILKKLAQNITHKEILRDYPRLTEGDIREVLNYAHSLVSKEEMYPLSM